LREYRGEPHRVESIGSVGQVEYFDDSKGTNVGATVAAISGLGDDASTAVPSEKKRKLVVILGGDGKGQAFEPLAAPVSQHARAVVLIGRDGPVIELALQNTGVPAFRAESMSQAVQLAAEKAQAGDAVLMSPACASFDMFDNYEHRAREFRAAVQVQAHETGASLEVHA
jgi:UDP-N-acetylmuramoylalanine--D-glutamate ligase